MKIILYPARSSWSNLLRRPVLDNRELDTLVWPILQDVLNRGDKALIEYTRKFDKVVLKDLRVNEEEFIEAGRLVDSELKKAIDTAIRNIESFHKMQQIKPVRVVTTSGVECWQKAVAIQKWDYMFREELPLYFPLC